MKKILIKTESKKMLADIYTPAGIYLRLRDRFRDVVIFESTAFYADENSFSFIGINAIAGIEITSQSTLEYKLPGQKAEKINIESTEKVPDYLWEFMQRFEITGDTGRAAQTAQGLYGYTAYDAVQFFDTIKLANKHPRNIGVNNEIPLMRYRLYQYVIAINHFKDELYLCENKIDGIESHPEWIESLIRSKDIPAYPFKANGEERSNMTNEEYIEIVKKGIASCHRGDVFQIVLSRRFEQHFTGDDFNVYRALRSINPSPYLFYFDYGDYKLFGSSPESELIIRDGKAIIHPIAGTFKRTGDDILDESLAEELTQDQKETAEHVMLVDLARNDLSKVCTGVQVNKYKQINYFSHVIHLVSEVEGTVPAATNPFRLLADTFPAGTLSGAPKFKAMQLIDENEPTNRGFYGGAIGFIGFDGSCNHAIMIRTFLCKNNTLLYQAGAGVVAASSPESELQEVNNKLGALKSAIILAEEITK